MAIQPRVPNLSVRVWRITLQPPHLCGVSSTKLQQGAGQVICEVMPVGRWAAALSVPSFPLGSKQGQKDVGLEAETSSSG